MRPLSVSRDITAESAEDVVKAANTKNPLKLGEILKGDIIEVVVDLIYTAMYESAQKDKENPYNGTFVEFVKDKKVDEQFIKNVAAKWEIDEITNDGKLNVSEIGNITASIHLRSNGIHVALDVLGAYVSLGGNLNSYVAVGADDHIALTSAETVGTFAGSNLEKALLELANYALGTTNFEFPEVA